MEEIPNVSTRGLPWTSNSIRCCCTSLFLKLAQVWGDPGNKSGNTEQNKCHWATLCGAPTIAQSHKEEGPIGGQWWKEPILVMCWTVSHDLQHGWLSVASPYALAHQSCWMTQQNQKDLQCWDDLRQASCAKYCAEEVIIQILKAAGTVTSELSCTSCTVIPTLPLLLLNFRTLFLQIKIKCLPSRVSQKSKPSCGAKPSCFAEAVQPTGCSLPKNRGTKLWSSLQVRCSHFMCFDLAAPCFQVSECHLQQEAMRYCLEMHWEQYDVSHC